MNEVTLRSGFYAEAQRVFPDGLSVQAERMHAPLPERFPRLTFLTVVVALLVTALTAEFDSLRGADISEIDYA